ncbi:MAG: tRNA guanosine(34) transglycosylase Tgt [Patescibacteria group bacterium]|nr:tRNA guanosine(34) transglycosylase Tgt [Patescibacteria group bacterium]
MFKINKLSKKTNARLGILKTAHGVIQTPFFMPVATQGTVKHISTEEMRRLNAQILLSNTYHLMLRPGEKLIKKYGGLHKFMDWQGPILTDSGGFQVFSLAAGRNKTGESLVKLTANGVKFKSYIDGREYYLTPEKSLKIQHALGVDIAVCLDECAALPAKHEYIEEAVELTAYWAKKTKKYYSRIRGKKPLLYAVVQGGLDKELRLRSLRGLIKIGFDGYNIGGLSVGETPEEMYAVLDYLISEMPAGKPRYLMGVGYPENIIEAVKRGVDMFDCVIPSREGRHGRLFQFQTSDFGFQNINDKFYQKININKAVFANDFSPINKDSEITELHNFSKAYLHYLFKIKEPFGQRLASLNNLEFYLGLMEKIRYNIKSNIF